MTVTYLATLADVGAGVPSGTSFPGGPANGDLFYRTDLDFLCRYRSSGTRWVTTTLFAEPIAIQDALIPATATGGLSAYVGLWGGIYDVYLETIICSTLTLATNDGTHYWTVQFARAPSSTNVGSSFNTSADTAGTYAFHNVTVNALMGTSDKQISANVTKTSTPGNLYLFGKITYRLVIT